jgi:uncharacterized protein (DUF885 family)
VPLALHEAVPGHHLQIALADELEGIPPFRRHAYEWAYVEGWGLYAESLGRELGLYDDPWARFGSLVFEMWRAARLVVDTGIHALGWGRQQTIDFMVTNVPVGIDMIETEVDRYIAMPGQAVSYKVGQLEILRLRRQRQEALGGAFDIKSFHDTVLGSGSVSLPVLRELVTAG